MSPSERRREQIAGEVLAVARLRAMGWAPELIQALLGLSPGTYRYRRTCSLTPAVQDRLAREQGQRGPRP